MLKEVLVVEGKMDTVAVKKAVDAETIETGGVTPAPPTPAPAGADPKEQGGNIMTGTRRAGGGGGPCFLGRGLPSRRELLCPPGGPGHPKP